jgi:ketosteroid isomerase-like protein
LECRGPREVPATRRKLDFAFAGIFHVADGKISSIRRYYDQIEVFTQLGLMPGATSS